MRPTLLTPLDLLDNHLRRLSRQVPGLNSEVRTQVRINFNGESSDQICPDYQAISWLVRTNQLKPAEAATLVEGIVISKSSNHIFCYPRGRSNFYRSQPISQCMQNKPLIHWCKNVRDASKHGRH